MSTSDPKREPTLCHGLLEAILASLRPGAESKGLKLLLARDLEDVVVSVDRRQFSRAIIERVGALIAQMEQGAIHVSIGQGAGEGGKWIAVRVSSDGTPADQASVLEFPAA
jgi:signal transduction histidine kinase